MKKQPKPPKPTGRAYSPKRWTIDEAAPEFDIERHTLSKRLRAASIEAGEDGRFSTKQLVTACYGDLEREKIRNESAAADLREMKRDQELGRLIPREAIALALEELRTAITQVIEHSSLPLKDKREIFSNLRKLNQHDFVATAAEDADE